MPDLKRRWAHLKVAFGPSGTTLTDLTGHSPSTMFKELALETWLTEPPNPLVNTPIANSAGLRVGTSWARSIIAADLPPDRGLIR